MIKSILRFYEGLFNKLFYTAVILSVTERFPSSIELLFLSKLSSLLIGSFKDEIMLIFYFSNLTI